MIFYKFTHERCSPGAGTLHKCYYYLLYKHTNSYTNSYYIYLSRSDTRECDGELEDHMLDVPSSRIASGTDSPVARQSSALRIARIGERAILTCRARAGLCWAERPCRAHEAERLSAQSVGAHFARPARRRRGVRVAPGSTGYTHAGLCFAVRTCRTIAAAVRPRYRRMFACRTSHALRHAASCVPSCRTQRASRRPFGGSN